MNIIFERPTLNRPTDKENLAIVDRWIADTVDKLNFYLNSELNEVSGEIPTSLAQLSDDSTHRTVTDEEINTWNNKPSSQSVYLVSDAEATTISDTDYMPYSNTFGKKRITWSYIKSILKTYLDTLYAAISHTHTKSEITDFSHTHTSSQVTDLSTTIDNKINALDVTGGSVGAYETISAWSETNGKVSITTQDIEISTNQIIGYQEPIQWITASAAAGSTSVTVYTDEGLSTIVAILATTYNNKPLKYTSVSYTSGSIQDYITITFPALPQYTQFQIGLR